MCYIITAAGGKESDDGFVAKLVTQIIKNIQVWYLVLLLHISKLICAHNNMWSQALCLQIDLKMNWLQMFIDISFIYMYFIYLYIFHF